MDSITVSGQEKERGESPKAENGGVPHADIHDERLRLRPTDEADLDLLAAWLADPDVYEFWGGTALSRREVADKYVGRRSPDVECFIIEDQEQPVGFVQYHLADDNGGGGGLDMVVLPAYRRKGIGRHCVRLLTGYLQREQGWRRITVDPDEINSRGVAFWSAVGFVPEQLVLSEQGRSPYWLMVFSE